MGEVVLELGDCTQSKPVAVATLNCYRFFYTDKSWTSRVVPTYRTLRPTQWTLDINRSGARLCKPFTYISTNRIDKAATQIWNTGAMNTVAPFFQAPVQVTVHDQKHVDSDYVSSRMKISLI